MMSPVSALADVPCARLYKNHLIRVRYGLAAVPPQQAVIKVLMVSSIHVTDLRLLRNKLQSSQRPATCMQL